MTSNPQLAVYGASVLVGGKLLSGTELLDYAKHKGLCPRCVQHTTHKRIKKRLGILRSEADWVPITVKDKEAGNYIVYKGYCLQPTCWTLAEAKSALGEAPAIRSISTMKSRSTTPGRERPNIGSVDDCVSVAHSESTFPCSGSLSTASAQQDQPSRHIGTTASSRNMTPGRRRGELEINHLAAVNRSQSVRQSTSTRFRDIDFGYDSAQSNASDNISTHSRDVGLLGRQSSSSSIVSDISDRSAHRRRISRKLLDVKVHESPRDVRPAMFYRQPKNGSDSSDNDSDEYNEEILQMSSAVQDIGATGRDPPARPLSRRRASIGNLFQGTPRIVTNLLSDSRATAASTRELRNYESPCENELTKTKYGRIAPDHTPESPVHNHELKRSPTEDESNRSRRSRLQNGKGKSSSNVQRQQNVSTAIRRTSISHVAHMQNARIEYNSTPSPVQDTKVQCSPSQKDSNHSRGSRLQFGKGKSSSNIHNHQKQGIAAPRRSSISHVVQVQNRDASDCNSSPHQQNTMIGHSSEHRLAVTPHRSPSDNAFLGIRDICPTPKLSTVSVSVAASPASSTHSHPENDQVELNRFEYRQSSLSEIIDSKRRSSCASEAHDMNHQEGPSMHTRRRASISFIAQSTASLVRNEYSQSPLSETSDSKRRTSSEMHHMNHHERSSMNTRRRASISFIAQPTANLVRNEMSPRGFSSTRDLIVRTQSTDKMHACTVEGNGRNQQEKIRNTTRRRASISYISQTSGTVLENALPSGGISLTHDQKGPHHRNMGKMLNCNSEEYSQKRSQRRASTGISFTSQTRSNMLGFDVMPLGFDSCRSAGVMHDVHLKRLSGSSISVASPALVYRRYSSHEASDDDNDADDILQMSIGSFHDSASTDLTKTSDVQSYAINSRSGTSLDGQDQSHSERLSESSIGSLLNYNGKTDDMIQARCSTEVEDSSDSSITRQSTPEIVILRHLCYQTLENVLPTFESESIIVPTEHLWKNLQKRYGDSSESGSGGADKMVTLLNVLDRTQDTECYEKCWALLSYLAKQGLSQQGISDDDCCNDLKLRIFQAICDEFDRENFDYNAKLHAAVAISHIVADEKESIWTTSTVCFHTMNTTLRLKWISVLSDVLHFRDFNNVEQRKGTVEVVDIICFLLQTEVKNGQDDRLLSERHRLLSKLIEVSFSILKVVAFEAGESARRDASFLCGAVFNMLALVASQTTKSSLEGHHVKCLYLIHVVMEKHMTEKTLHQGLFIAKEILSKLTTPDVSGVGEFDETICQTIAAAVNEMSQTSLSFEQKNPSPTMILETISLVSLLLESNNVSRQYITNSAVLQRPTIVDAIIRLIDSSSDTQLVDEGLFILLCLVTKNPSSGAHLREIPSIACRIVMWLTRYNEGSVQEFICLILEYLVSEDYTLGQEIGSIGGLVVLCELFYIAAQSNSSNLIHAASRAMVGILAVVDKKILYEYNAILKKNVVDSMSSNFSNFDLQGAGLSIIHCVCLRTDSVPMEILPTVVKSMENHFEDVSLLTKSCSIIRMISMKSEGCTAIAETDALRSVINSLLVHPTSTDLVLEGMATIKDLARKESFRAFFNPEDAEAAIVSILPLHSKNPEAVALIFASLNNIAVNAKISKVAPMQLDVLHFILSALTAFRDNHHVTRNACLLLKSYTYNKDNLNIIRSYSEPVIRSLSTCFSSPQSETRDRARYIMKKLQSQTVQ